MKVTQVNSLQQYYTNIKMTAKQLYTYPVKSLRGVPLSRARLTKHGFPYDRRYMLMKVNRDDSGQESLKTMIIGKVSELALFTQELDEEEITVKVTYHPPDGSTVQCLFLPLQPDYAELREIDTNYASSPTRAYDMGAEYNDFFSSCLGYAVVLAYIGNHKRAILGNLSPNQQQQRQTSWTSSISSKLFGSGAAETDPNALTFADVANYLVITEESLADVSARLPDGVEMDPTKFRPNIVVGGAPAAWDEDFWAKVDIGGVQEEKKELTCTAHCHRCQSINVDYVTGKYQKGEGGGEVLKKLMKDRRVDPGAKWSPVFGRYGFLTGEEGEIKVGDEVGVKARNEGYDTFEWPGM